MLDLFAANQKIKTMVNNCKQLSAKPYDFIVPGILYTTDP